MTPMKAAVVANAGPALRVVSTNDLRAGSREPAASPWLEGSGDPVVPVGYVKPAGPRLEPWAFLAVSTIAPATTIGAFMDWWTHLVRSPAKQLELASAGAEQLRRAWEMAVTGTTVQPLPQDKRFADPAWQLQPYRGLMQAFLLEEQWWQCATTEIRGVTAHHEQMVSFAARQWLDMAAPSNFVVTNPVVQRQTLQECGLNLFRGVALALEDASRDAADLPPAGAEAFDIGRTVAITPGRVVLRNRLMELIQYAPTTPTVHLEPVLVVPAWIMKYYVLDLSPGNSLVRHLVDHGYTVFAISWKNPTSEHRDLGMDDYVNLGVRAALQAIGTIVPGAQVHATGYCLGGTLLATVAAALGRTDGTETPLKTLTLQAAQTDFTAPGEIGLFIDEGQVASLENLMAQRGYLDKKQMQSTFQMLRSNDLIWSHRLQSQLLGQRRPLSDLMAWNADGTRLPARMHSEYLRGMYLNNALARSEWRVNGKPVHLTDIRVPIFNVGTAQDHVAPWRSVFRLHALTDAEQTFVLTTGGHNVGIVNPPGQAKSSYRMRTWHAGDRLLTPDDWLAATEPVSGTWWTAWEKWLRQHSTRRVAPPSIGAVKRGLPPLDAAPGRYVHER